MRVSYVFTAYIDTYTHIHYIILGMLIAYRTKLLSPLSSKTRASASWLTIPLFIFRLFPGLRICTILSL